MTNKELLYIITIAELGNFSHAANKLNISQSALSQAIHKVEEDLGFMLFFRGGMKTCPTALGKQVIKYGKPLLDKWNNFESKLNDYSNLNEKCLNVYAPPLFCKSFIPVIVRQFNKVYPSIKVNVVENNSLDVEKSAENEISDISLVWEPVANDSLSRIPVFKTELLLVVPSNHPFCQKRPFAGFENISTVSMKDFEELKDYPFSLPNYSRTKKIVTTFIDSLDFKPNVKESTKVWSYLIDYVANGERVALVDELECMCTRPSENLAFYRLEKANLNHSVVACFCQGKKLSDSVQLFLDMLKEYPSIAKQNAPNYK